MPIQIGICDDSSHDTRILLDALYAYDSSFQISVYTSGEALLESCCSPVVFDILFVDIYMPGLNGIDTAGKARALMRDVKIIFISSSNEHYPEAYDLFAFNYIVKPLDRDKLNRILDHALADIARERLQQISFSYKGVTHRIYCRDILYIESRDKTVYFHMADTTRLQCYAKMDDILKQLPEESFIRCHQSFAVNVAHVNEMAADYFRISSTIIGMSKKYMKAAKSKYFAQLLKHL